MRSLSLRSAAFLGRLWMSLKRSCDSASNRRLRRWMHKQDSQFSNFIFKYENGDLLMVICSGLMQQMKHNELFSDLLASLSNCSSFDQWMTEWMSSIILVSPLQLFKADDLKKWMDRQMDGQSCPLTCSLCSAEVWPKRSRDTLSPPLECWSPSQVTTWGHRIPASAVVYPPTSEEKGAWMFIPLSYCQGKKHDFTVPCPTWSALLRTTLILSSCPLKALIASENSSEMSSLWASNSRMIRSTRSPNHRRTSAKS